MIPRQVLEISLSGNNGTDVHITWAAGDSQYAAIKPPNPLA